MSEVRRLDAVAPGDSRGPLVLTAKKLTVLVKIPNELLRWHVPTLDDARFVPEDECDDPVIVDQQGK